jgi:hypothetical protein
VISDRTIRLVCALTRSRDVEPDTGHKLRVAAHSGRMTPDQATRAINLLKALPQRSERSWKERHDR